MRISDWSSDVCSSDLVVGAVPGFAAHNTIIILLPFTLAVDVEIGMTFMIALYCATHLGGGIPAILVNIPGTGGAAATTLDGYPMAQQGKGQQALMLCFFASVFGGDRKSTRLNSSH